MLSILNRIKFKKFNNNNNVIDNKYCELKNVEKFFEFVKCNFSERVIFNNNQIAFLS